MTTGTETVATFLEALGRVHSLAEARRSGPCPLVGISGIDGSGKSTLAGAMARELGASGVRVALLGVDDWHNPREKRFSLVQPGPHFFEHGLRLEEMFARLVTPLRRTRGVDVTINALQSAAGTPARKSISFRDVGLILVEGIFIFRRELRRLFDLAVWVDCPFEVALERARARNQEGLPDAENVRDYHVVYFPAQRYHFERDCPKETADLIIQNDARRTGQ